MSLQLFFIPEMYTCVDCVNFLDISLDKLTTAKCTMLDIGSYCLSVCSSLRVFIHLSVYIILPVYLYLSLSFFIHLFIYVFMSCSISLSIQVFIYLSICLFIYLSIYNMYLSICLLINISIYQLRFFNRHNHNIGSQNQYVCFT